MPHRTHYQKKSLFFLVLSVIFLVGMLKTRRMQEYFAPFTVIFAAFSLNENVAKFKGKKAVRYVFIGLICIIAILSLVKLDTNIKNNQEVMGNMVMLI